MTGRAAAEPATADPDAAGGGGSDAALARYRVALRKQRLVYFSVVGAILVVLIVVVSVAWSRGEVANTTLHTVDAAPANLRIATASATATGAWHTTDRAAVGNPRYEGTVVVYGRHTVRGLDARTGAQTWSYTRSNRVVCAALQSAGTTVAVYEVGGNCDELTALASDTGDRRWTRTLDQDGQPVNGQPTYQVLSYTVLVTTPDVVYAIDPGSGYNRWTYGRFGCAITHAVLGSAGALISQNCTDPRCAALKFCGRGPQLLLRNGNAGVDDKDTTNPDQIVWNHLGNTDVPVSADSRVSALNTATRALDLFNATSGASNGATVLSPTPSASGAVSATATDDAVLVTVRGVAAALGGSAQSPDWSRSVSGPLTAVPPTDAADLTESTARITVPTATGAAVLDGTSGRVTAQVTLSPRPAAGASIYPLGSGQLVTSASGTVAYR